MLALSILSNLRQDLDQVGSYTHGSHSTTSTGTLDNQRVASIPLSVEADDVVAALEGGNGVRAVKLLESNLDLLGSSVDASNESDNLTGLLGSGLGLLHLLVKGRELLEELVTASAGLELLGDEALHGEGGGGLDRETSQAGQDSQLASNVETVEIVSGVRLSVAKRLGVLDLVRPLAALALGGSKGVEEERHGAAEDTLNLGDLVASLN